MVPRARSSVRARAVTGLCRSRRDTKGTGALQLPRGEPNGRMAYSPGLVGSVIKKRRKKMRKHKHKKMLKKTRWQRRG